MKRDQRRNVVLSLLVVLLGGLGLSGAPFAMAQGVGPGLASDFAAARSYTFGESREALARIEEAVAQAGWIGDIRERLERQVLELLNDPTSTRDARRFACRQLRVVGSKASVVTLSNVLEQEEGMADVASYALEMIDDESVADEVLPLLDITSGTTLVEVIEVLGAQKAAAAVGKLAGLGTRDDVLIAGAAIDALGKIGVAPAGKALLRLSGAFGNPALRDEVRSAILLCAEEMSTKLDKGLSLVLARGLVNDRTAEPTRLGALRLLVAMGDAEGIGWAVEAAVADGEDGDGSSWQKGAAEILRKQGDGVVTVAIAEQLGVGDDADVVLLGILAARGDGAAEVRVLECLEGHEVGGNLEAAYRVLGAVGTVESVGVLVAALEEGSEAAEVALGRLRGDRVDTALLSAIEASADDGLRVKLLRTLAARGRSADALALLRKFMAEGGANRTVAIRALATWVDDGPAEDLAAVMEDGQSSEVERGLALAGLVEMMGKGAARENGERIALLKRALTVCDTDEQRADILRGLGKVADVDALFQVAPWLTDPTVGRAAAAAVVEIAGALPTEERYAALAGLELVEKLHSGSTDLMKRVQSALREFQRHDDFILAWQLAGPYRRDGVDANDVLAEVFLPETDGDDARVVWKDLWATDVELPGKFDLTGLADPANCATYVRTQIWVDEARQVLFEFGSDDGIKVWVNGVVELTNNAHRGVTLADDRLLANLNAGWNSLMLKISQGGGGYGFAGRVRDAAGGRIAGLRVDPLGRSVEAPADAVVLLGDGRGDLSAWEKRKGGGDVEWLVDEATGVMTIATGTGDIITRETFEDFSLHLEFRTPTGLGSEETGQARGNSGVYIFGSYEVQILDSWGLGVSNSGCGAIYGKRSPNVNVARAGGVWQSFDMDFIAARWSDDGATKVSNARITVRQNGVLIHDDVVIDGPTGAGQAEVAGGGGIVLQDHGNAVEFRNIWIVRHSADAALSNGQDLFNGVDLTGWTQRGGQAAYLVEDGEIVGETRPNQANSFLCTEGEYGDFILDLEYWVSDELNSGIQIRSNATPTYSSGRVHGYQVEIDPSERAWSAGIYDESRRGWLAPLTDYEAARGAFVHEDWNRLRVIARGDVMRTYLNGVPAAMLVDGTTARGFIGLQVHGVGGRTDPLRVRWRNIRLQSLD